MNIEIEYCVPCGYLDKAIDAQRTLLTQFGNRLGSVTLKTGRKGVFTFRADENIIYSKPDEFDIAAIVDAVGALLPEPEAIQPGSRELLFGH